MTKSDTYRLVKWFRKAKKKMYFLYGIKAFLNLLLMNDEPLWILKNKIQEFFVTYSICIILYHIINGLVSGIYITFKVN